MAPHLSTRELDRCFSLYAAGKTLVEIRDLVSRARESLDVTGLDLTTVHRALRGATHKRGPAETRGRKPKLTAVKLRALNKARGGRPLWRAAAMRSKWRRPGGAPSLYLSSCQLVAK